MPPDELVRWRGEVLDQLGSQIGLTGPDARDQVRARLEAIDPSAWVGSGEAAPNAPTTPKEAPKPVASPPPKPAQKPKPKPTRERPSRRLLGLLALLVVLVIAVAAISLSGDDDSGEPTPPPPPTTTQPTDATSTESTTTEPSSTTTTPTPPSTPPVALDALPGMPDRGMVSATVTGAGDDRSIEVQLKDMPAPGGGKGVYAVWLYNTLIGAELLGTVDRGDGSVSAPLPENAADFRYLDISRESGPDDRVHSGVSVRRAELAPLLSTE